MCQPRLHRMQRRPKQQRKSPPNPSAAPAPKRPMLKRKPWPMPLNPHLRTQLRLNQWQQNLRAKRLLAIQQQKVMPPGAAAGGSALSALDLIQRQ